MPQSLVICHPLALFKSTRCTWTWVFESHTCASHRIIKAGRDLLEERFLPREDFLGFGMRYPRDWRQKEARREFRLLDSLLSFINPLLPALLFSLMFLFWVSPPRLLQPRLCRGFLEGQMGTKGPNKVLPPHWWPPYAMLVVGRGWRWGPASAAGRMLRSP